METSPHPFVKSLSSRGFVQGSTLTWQTTNKPLCHFFGGLRYALAPSERWRKAHKLPSSYTYGTRERPGQHDGGAGVCPQPGFRIPADQSDWNEDCFQCNVWVPVGEPPKEGWPVLIYIHGGWLQFGTPNTFSVASLLGETSFKAVVVMPAYRLNVFGFLYSSELEQDAASVGETVGNHGFWDQRLALEWTKENVYLFGGNADNITISGYSAGAYSVFHQLAYDLRQPQSTSIIKQACIWSNGPGVQPKNKTDAQTQFNQLLSALNISPSLPASAKLSILRTAPPKTLIDAAASIQIHQFRPSTDNTFISASLFQSLDDGSFASALKARNIRILLGECRDEHSLYGIWHPPPENNIPSLRNRLLADYPAPIVDALIPLYTPTSGPDAGKLPPGFTNWGQDGFGRIYADMQVHALQRGLIHSLSVAGASHLLYRYRIEYRLSCVDESLPPEWGVTHTADMPIWFFGNGVGKVNEGREREIVKKGILDPFTKFINGDAAIGWGTEGCRQVRTLRSDGEVVIWEDGLWDWALRVWGTLRRVDTLGSRSGSGSGGRSAKL